MLYAMLEKEFDDNRFTILFTPVIGYEKVNDEYLPIVIWYNGDSIGPVYKNGTYRLIKYITERQIEITKFNLKRKVTEDYKKQYEIITMPFDY